MTREPGSFRDPDGQVHVQNGRIFRVLSERGRDDWRAAHDAGIIDDLIERDWLVQHELVPSPPSELPDGAAVLEATLVPVISYPYEWSFEMLRDAALLTLDVTAYCVERGFHLKDASAYNVAFVGGRPLFIDVGSIAQGHPGRWPGYAQFVAHFLSPLLITSRLDIAFQPLLRSHLNGIPVEDAASMFRGRSTIGKGVPLHLKLSARAERKAKAAGAVERSEMRRTVKLPASAVLGNVRRLRKLVSELQVGGDSEWSEYEGDNTYSDGETSTKVAFVHKAAAEHAGTYAWDIGANAGQFSVALAKHFAHVVSIEYDAATVDRLYARARSTPAISPIVMNIADPSPSRGWRLLERADLQSRAPADFSVWLAVIHHLCLALGYPIEEVLDLVADVSPVAVIEYVDPEDKMGVHLLASRPEIPHGYGRERFNAALQDRFEVLDHLEVKPTRSLWLVKRR